MYRKRGQEGGGGAAALVSIIALLIVLYIIFLPPDVRKDLLDGDSAIGGSSDNVDDEYILLQESPGRLDYLGFSEYEHPISPIYLLRSVESEELKTWSAFNVKNGVFDKKFYQTRFRIKDLEHTDNLVLSFIVRDFKGDLVIKLNGEEIFSGMIPNFNPPPITLSKELLVDDNVFDFEVSSVGWQFWKTNEYLIEHMKVIAKVTDISRQESRNVFVLRDMEYFNLDAARLRFNPNCRPIEVGQLEITLNSQVLYTGIPDCGIPNTKEFSIGMLNRGENSLLFKTSKGSYLIDNIEVKTELRNPDYPLYHFELNETIWEDLEDKRLDIELRLKFIDGSGRKQGIVHVNGRTFSFSTTDKDWDKDIYNHVEEDDNWIKIMPDRGVLDVINLEVVLIED